MPASDSLETVFVRFNPFLMGDIFIGYLGTSVTPTVVQLGFAKPLLDAWRFRNAPANALTADDHLASGISSMNLEDRFSDVQTDCRDRLHELLL
jgi:hypothetical protein